MKSYCGIIFFFIITGCTNQTMYHSYHHVPQDKGWQKNDTIPLHISITDTLKSYQLYFIVRNDIKYPYRNFSASITYNFPDSNVWVSDTLEIMLANTDGKWLGSGSAGLYQTSFLLKEAMIPRSGENYTFKVKHLFNDEYLKGLCDIGIQAKSTE